MKKNSRPYLGSGNRMQNQNALAVRISEKENGDIRASLNFIIRFISLFVIFEICYITPYIYNHFFTHINTLFAASGSYVLNWFHYNTTHFLSSINSSQFSLSVQRGCDSLEALAIFVFGVMAFPASFKIKSLGLLLGSFTILLFNLIRIIHLFWTGVNHPDLFDLFHLEIWQFYFIAQSVILWLVWMRQAVVTKKP